MSGEHPTQVRISVKQLDADLAPLERIHEEDAGLDLRARIDVTLSTVTGQAVVPTGVAVAIPDGFVGLVCPRSGLAAAQGVSVLNAPGIIDPGYRGEIQVVLFSIRNEAVVVRRGSRIAQLVVVPFNTPTVEVVAELPHGTRGPRGLGSSDS
jgi:dUTP pyrophosphatase